jgi:hypothetical protein
MATEQVVQLAVARSDDSPLQRCWRDVHAAACRVFFSNDHQVHGGKVLLGQPADEWLM